MQLGCAIMTLKSKNRVCGKQKKKQNGAGIHTNDFKE